MLDVAFCLLKDLRQKGLAFVWVVKVESWVYTPIVIYYCEYIPFFCDRIDSSTNCA